MSRRRSSARKGQQIPVILYAAWPLWGPIVNQRRKAKKARTKADQITKSDLAAVVKAAKTGDVDKLEAVATKGQPASKVKAWRYTNRQVVDAGIVALAVAASKLLLLGPWVLPLFGLLIFAALFAATPVWLGKVARGPLPELKARLLDRLPAATPPKLQAVAARVCSPFTGAVLVALAALVWWARPLDRRAAILSWLVVTIVTLAVRAWRFRVRPHELVTSTGSREGDWEEHIAGKVTVAKGSVLAGTDDFHNERTGDRLGWTGGIVLPQGSKGVSAVAPALRGPIATTYNVGVEDVMIERLEKSQGGFDERRAIVTVLDEPGSNAVLVVHEYDGSDFDRVNGTWTQAIRADWKPATGQLYQPGIGGFSTHFSGETGGGKSEGMETMLRSITSAGVVAPWIIDLGGATFVDWREHVEIFVDNPADAVQLLANHGALIQLRQHKLGKMRQLDEDGRDVGPRRVYPIDREHPCIPGVFDEWEFALGDATIGKSVLELSEAILTQQRKVVVPAIFAGQSTGLRSGFKNSNRARTQFQAGNMIAFKNNSESGAQAFGKQIQVNPSELPLAHKGSCYMTSNVDARDAMARSRWVRRPRLWDGQIDIPQLPSDEVDVLTRGLSTRPFQVQVPGVPGPREPEAVTEPTAPAPTLQLVKPARDLADEVAEWIIQQERPVRRQEVVEEFGTVRMRANSRSVDNALKAAKERGLVVSDAQGYYSVAVKA